MKNILTLIFLFNILLISEEQAQISKIHSPHKSSDSVFFSFKKQIVPVGLITTGLIIESLNIKQDLQNSISRTDTKTDNYIQWAPVAIMYSSYLFNNKHRDNLFNQTKYLIISELATAAVTQALKRITNVTRPNGGRYSFPSGHTSQSFTGATVLYNEFKDYSVPLALSGYLFSSTTAALRVTNNRHWVPDVLAGAGLAIFITNLVYFLEPLKNWIHLNQIIK